ncbi:MAG: type II toxin-antitoxin system Phd/YefM family antitoxin [Beijerinckiaceae bacterium]|jgi:prevent-host-death family protein
MEISVSDAKAQLTELVRRAEAGDEIILTRHGQPTVRFVPVKVQQSFQSRQSLMASIRASAQLKTDKAVPSVARSQDDLYGEDGMP